MSPGRKANSVARNDDDQRCTNEMLASNRSGPRVNRENIRRVLADLNLDCRGRLITS